LFYAEARNNVKYARVTAGFGNCVKGSLDSFHFTVVAAKVKSAESAVFGENIDKDRNSPDTVARSLLSFDF
jgi:hypothetical protein